MAILNKATWAAKFAAFINRDAPFDGNPLIQKTEHLEVSGEDLPDSIIFKEPEVVSISSPGATFTADFATADEFTIDTSASIGSTFAVTLDGLENNRIGRLDITKKSADIFSFANGTMLPFGTIVQTGTSISFLIIKVGSAYFAQALKQESVSSAALTGASGWSETNPSGFGLPRCTLSLDGWVDLSGYFRNTGAGVTVTTLPAAYRPNVIKSFPFTSPSGNLARSISVQTNGTIINSFAESFFMDGMRFNIYQ